jgi:hypothetical protein
MLCLGLVCVCVCVKRNWILLTEFLGLYHPFAPQPMSRMQELVKDFRNIHVPVTARLSVWKIGQFYVTLNAIRANHFVTNESLIM